MPSPSLMFTVSLPPEYQLTEQRKQLVMDAIACHLGVFKDRVRVRLEHEEHVKLPCRCGHPKEDHSGLAGDCIAEFNLDLFAGLMEPGLCPCTNFSPLVQTP